MKLRSILFTGAVALAMVGGGVAAAGAASASTTSPATHTTSTASVHFCNSLQLQRWTVNGRNTVNLTLAPTSSPFSYKVTFQQFGSCLRGSLTDTYYPGGPVKLAVYGTVYKNHITFSVRYPDTTRALRTFTGTIGKWGAVSGTWCETGTYHESGAWSLAKNARPVYYRFYS